MIVVVFHMQLQSREPKQREHVRSHNFKTKQTNPVGITRWLISKALNHTGHMMEEETNLMSVLWPPHRGPQIEKYRITSENPVCLSIQE